MVKKKKVIRKRFAPEEKGLLVVIALLFITIVVLSSYIYSFPFSLELDKEKKLSAEIIEITGDCENCFDIASLSNVLIEENNLEVKSHDKIEYTSSSGKNLIEKYGIKRVPALVVISKDVENINFDTNLFTLHKNYAIFDKSVPYIELGTSNIKGTVNLIEIQPDNCIECYSLSSMKAQFEKFGIKSEYQILSESSKEARNLIEKNNITFLPSLLISKDINEYWWLFDQLKGAFVEKDEYFIIDTPVAPYVSLYDNQIKGKVAVTYLENKSCTECFNITQLKSGFTGVGIYLENEEFVDVSSSEGKKLVNMYNITAIPTIILSKEIQDYPANTKEALKKIGSFETDDLFILRRLDSLNVVYQKV